MADWAVQRRERIVAQLNMLPDEAIFRLSYATGVFAPIAPLVDDAETTPSEAGFVRASSLPAIWRWFRETIAPERMTTALEVFVASAVGMDSSREKVTEEARRLRTDIGRPALAALARRPMKQLVNELGGPRAVEDARLVAAAFAVADRLEPLMRVGARSLDAVPTQIANLVAKIASHEPDSAGVVLCLVLSKLRTPAAITPLACAIARRRDEARLDRSHIAISLNCAIERAATHGSDELTPGMRPSRRAVEVVDERARAEIALAVALREHTTSAWMRRLNERVQETSESLAALCERCVGLVKDAVLGLDEPNAPDALARARAAVVFLTGVKSAAVPLQFDETQRRAVSEVRASLREVDAGAIEEGLAAVADRSVSDAVTLVRMLTQIFEQLEGPEAARAWERRARRPIGRPSFQDQVLAAVAPVAVDDPSLQRRRGQIDRRLLDRLWDWMVSRSQARDIATIEARYEEQRDAAPERAAAVVEEFRASLLERLREGLDNGSVLRELRATPDERGQIETIIALFTCDPVAREVLARWPERIKHVTEEHIAAIRDLHDELVAEVPDVEPSLLLVVMERLDRPWQIFRILERIAKTRRDTLVEATEFGSIGEILIDRAEADARAFARGAAGAFRADSVIAALERFAGVASGMGAEFEIRKSGVWGRRLYALKARAARDLETMCEEAVTTVEEITPRRYTPNGAWAPDPSRRISDEKVQEAAQRARFLRNAKILDHRAAFAGARSRAITMLDARLDDQIKGLLDMAHAGVHRDAALVHLNALTEVVGEFRGEEAGHILQRRAAAA